MTTVATPDTRNRMNTTLVMRPEQPARADAMAALSLPSRRGDSLHAPQRPISMASNPRMHASTGSELKPVDHSSPINNARFCRRTGAPEMMTNPNTYKTPHQTAKEQAEAKNADVLRVLAANKNALTPTEIAWGVENSPGGESWSIQRIPGHKPMANTSLVNAVLKRIKAVKVGRGLWLKPGAKLTSSPPLMAGIPSTGRPCPTASACADSFSKAPTSRTPMRDGELPEISMLGSNCLMAKEEFGTVVATEGSLPQSRPSRPVRSDLGLNPEACRFVLVKS